MSIIPVSSLSASDLSELGNNLTPPARPSDRQRTGRRRLAAVNRSLAVHGESVARLFRRPRPSPTGAE